MSRWEKTNKRDLTYSQWHRTLGDNYPTLDIDFIEVRRNEPVAVIEVKYYLGEFSTWHKSIYVKLALALGVPLYFVKHNCIEDTQSDPSTWFFIVEDIFEQTTQRYNLEQYTAFLQGL